MDNRKVQLPKDYEYNLSDFTLFLSVTVKDHRIMRLDEIVSEVKQSEEWEEAKVSIYKIGLENGRVKGILQMLFQLVKKGRLSQSEAAEEAGLTEEEFLKRMEEVHK